MPSIAQTYVGELRNHVDASVVPIYPPNAIVPVGAIGTIADGRFITRVTMQELGRELVTTPDAAPVDMVYATSGRVNIGPTAEVPGPGGTTLAKATLSFAGGKAVLASMKSVSGVRANVREFDRILWELLLAKELASDEVAVWSVSTAVSGAVVVAVDKSSSIDVSVPVGGVLGFAQLSVGASFSNDRNTSFHLSGGPFTVSVRLRRPTPNAGKPVGDVFGIEPPAGTFANVVVDELL
jgi:hypothetical protein